MSKKFLVIMTKKSMGDVLLNSTVCENIKLHCKDNIVHYVVYESCKELFEDHEHIDKLLVLNRKEGIKGYLKLITAIAKEKYDVVIDYRTNGITALLAFLSKAKTRIGIEKRFSRILNNIIIDEKKFTNEDNMVKRYNTYIEPLGIECKTTEHKIYVKDEVKLAQKKFMEDNGIDFSKTIIAMNVTTRDESRSYAYMFQIVNEVLKKYDCQVILVYTPDELQAMELIYEKLEEKDRIFTNFKPKSSKELAIMLKNCDYFIGHQGGARHLAEAVGIKTFCLIDPRSVKKLWIINEGENHQCVGVDDVNVEKYEDIPPNYVLSKIDNFIKQK